ncbi:MAG: 6-bladed beta-propeller, partial [Atribacterota bacterium]
MKIIKFSIITSLLIIVLTIYTKEIKVNSINKFSDIFKENYQVSLKTKNLNVGMLGNMEKDIEGNFIFIDWKLGEVFLFSENGKFKKKLGKKGQGPGEFQLPLSVTTDKEGKIYIADNITRRINILDKDGKYSRSFIISGAHWVPSIMKIDTKKEIYMGGYKENFEKPLTGTWIHKYNS